mgnify:CR=1 FL=1
MFTNSKTANAVRLALVAGVATASLSTTAAFANEAEAKDVERIAVTGSRIKRADMENASPVTVIDASDIAATGATSIDAVLQTMTASGGAMTNPGVNNGSGGNARVNLRGLGAERTLVLVNGRRMIASGTGAASSVDLNTIPVSMIQRIEVLKDGASAVYGTDAVSGVVNVILKRDYEGFELNVQAGQSGHGDADNRSIDFTIGASSDKGNLVFGVQYTDRGEARQADRDFSNCPVSETKTVPPTLYCGGSSYSEGGHVWGDNMFGFRELGKDEKYVVGDAGHYGEMVAKTDADGNIVYQKDADGNDTTTPATKFKYFDGMSEADVSGRGGEYHDYVNSGADNDKYNYSASSYLFTPMQRINLTASGTYELSDDMLFFTEATYTKRWSSQQMAPQPIWNSEAWVYNPISGGGVDGVDGWMTDDLMPFAQVGEELSYGRRMVDTGTRNYSQVVDTVRIVMGVEGELENGWMWDVSYNKGRNDSVAKTANLHNIGAINDAVQAGDFDPFLQSSWQGDSISPFTYTEVESGGSEMDIFAASLSGDILDTDAGTIGFAAGYEHRLESAYFTPDSLTAQGLANDPRSEPTAGSFNVNEAYVEFAIPLVSDSVIADNIELSAAMRYFDYSTFGDDVTWKLGLQWRLNEEFMFRSVVSTAFRAPTVDELFGGESPSFEQVQHAASEQDQAEVTVGGNPLLTPEEADILTLGFVYEPEAIEGLSITVDYYDIDITNAINTVDDSYIAATCLGSDGSLINTGLAMCKASNIALDNTGRITFNNGLQNLGGQATEGVDINAAYSFEAAGLNWRASLDTSLLDKFVETDQDNTAVDFTGFITAGAGAYAKVKSNLTLAVNSDDWDATYTARYIGGMDSFLGKCQETPEKCYAPTVGSVTYHDIAGSYHVNDSMTLSGGIKNLADKQPPYYTGNNDSNTDPYTYDVLGRYFFVKANFKF